MANKTKTSTSNDNVVVTNMKGTTVSNNDAKTEEAKGPKTKTTEAGYAKVVERK